MKLICICGIKFTVNLNQDGYSFTVKCRCGKLTELNRRCNGTWFTLGYAIPA